MLPRTRDQTLLQQTFAAGRCEEYADEDLLVALDLHAEHLVRALACPFVAPLDGSHVVLEREQAEERLIDEFLDGLERP